MSDGGGGTGAAGRHPGRQPPWEKTQPEPGSFGEWLRRQREMREISLRDIAERTKISLRYLEAMEEDRFDVLPAPIFAKGFLREYARYVGLSPDEVVNHYLSVQGPQEGLEEGKEDTRAGRERARKTRGWTWGLFLLLAGALLLALVAAFAWWAQKRRDDSSLQQPPPPIAAPPRVAPAAAPSVPPPEAASAPLEVALDFTENCWVEAVVLHRLEVAQADLGALGDVAQRDLAQLALAAQPMPEGAGLRLGGALVPGRRPHREPFAHRRRGGRRRGRLPCLDLLPVLRVVALEQGSMLS